MRNFVTNHLRECAKTYQERNKVYGDCYKNQGDVMKILFPKGLPVYSPEDWNRLGILMKIQDKLVRYSANFTDGGHDDSLHDISVYCIMLMELDTEMRGESNDENNS